VINKVNKLFKITKFGVKKETEKYFYFEGIQENQETSYHIFFNGLPRNFRIIELGSQRVLIETSFEKGPVQIGLYAEHLESVSLVKVIKWRPFYILLFTFRDYTQDAFSKIHLLFLLILRGIKLAWTRHHFLISPSMMKDYIRIFRHRISKKSDTLYYLPNIQIDYIAWLHEQEHSENVEAFMYNPKISIVIPVFNVSSKFLNACVNSVLDQNYQNFEICIVNDASTSSETLDCLNSFEVRKDERIKIKHRTTNGHISVASNDGVEMSSGEFVALLDNDDLLSSGALSEVVRVLNVNPRYDLIYSDEDKIDESGLFCDPHFKPDFSLDTLLSMNYICHFLVLRKSVVNEVGGFRVGYEGSQDYDIVLRMIGKTNIIHHIPKVLYHWRIHSSSTSANIGAKDYAIENGKKAISSYLEREGIKGNVRVDPKTHYYMIDYLLLKQPLITIVIPTRDNLGLLKSCINSIINKTKYTNYDIIIVDNGSVEKVTLSYFESIVRLDDRVKVISIDIPFNYSRLNNLAVNYAKGEFLVLLNNDTEVISPEWLDRMIGYASQNHIGAVGAKLLYSDQTVQHAGVVLGIGGVASHVFLNSYDFEIGLYARLSVVYNYSAVTGACLMVKKSKYLEVSGLDETLEVAYNDIDFCLKLIEIGYYNVVLPDIKLYHYESKSRGSDTTLKKYRRFKSESEIMNKKWKDLIDNDPFYNPNFSHRGCFVLDKEE
jgi:O-antigen biosynthesis protein